MDFLKNKYYGLPGYVWIGVIGAGVFIYWRIRSGSATADTSGTDTVTGQDQLAGAEGAIQGYDQGYNAGYAQGTVVGTPPVTTSGSGDCKQRKDPSGKMHLTCGQGFWVRGASGGWRWVEGPKPNGPIHIVKGKYRPPKPKKRKPVGHGSGSGR